MDLRIALAGNPNCGKTTLFNALTGANQFVGNWPGVTVEKKEGKLKKQDGVIITDLPGIYSLSPYTLEEVVARNYLIGERPDAILNIIDGTNLERNLYLTTQLTELGIPVVIAINMMDVVQKNGDKIDINELSRQLGCKIVAISALKGTGITEAAEAAVEAARTGRTVPMHTFSGTVEHALAHIEEAAVHGLPEEQQRWYAVKIFERDDKVLADLSIDKETLAHIEEDIRAAESELDDDAESIITNERYIYIASIIKACYQKKNTGRLSSSDKIDRIVTNRWLGLPIFAIIMFLVYYLSMVTVGTAATDWANDGLFGDGWHLFGIGTSQYEEAAERYGDSDQIINAFAGEYGDETVTAALDMEDESYTEENAKNALEHLILLTPEDASVIYETEDEETPEVTEHPNTGKTDRDGGSRITELSIKPPTVRSDVSAYGGFRYSVLIGNGLKGVVADWLSGLILDGIVAGVGAVLGFVPQMLVLFLLLAFLEACGYMSRIAFVLDRVFRKFGLSGKSFIPMLIGTGCGVPGIMASRTIENERDRRMTIMTTTFIPCGAKVPFISMIAGAIFGGSAWIATSAYFVGMASIVVSGIMLKKTRMFAGEPAPFVMELPAYHWPTVKKVLRSMWERGWSFIAGTIILLSTIIWSLPILALLRSFRMLTEENWNVLWQRRQRLLHGSSPLGWVIRVTLTVQRKISSVPWGFFTEQEMSIKVFGCFTGASGYSFLVFNLLCAPCFAAIGAIKREMNSRKWTWFAISYQCLFAYAVAFMVNQFGSLFTGKGNIIGLIAALAILAGMIYMLVKPYKEPAKLTAKINTKGKVK